MKKSVLSNLESCIGMLEGVRLGMHEGNPYLPSHHDGNNPPGHSFYNDGGYPITHHNPVRPIKQAEETLFDILKGVRASFSDYSSEVKAEIGRFKSSINPAYELDYGYVHLKVSEEITGWQAIKIDQALFESLASDIILHSHLNDVQLSGFIHRSSSADMETGLSVAIAECQGVSAMLLSKVLIAFRVVFVQNPQ